MILLQLYYYNNILYSSLCTFTQMYEKILSEIFIPQNTEYKVLNYFSIKFFLAKVCINYIVYDIVNIYVLLQQRAKFNFMYIKLPLS